MRQRRSIGVLAASLLAIDLAAQEPLPALKTVETPFGPAARVFTPPTRLAAPRWTLWVVYPDDRGAFLDHAQYLNDLQRRFAGAGIAIDVVMPAKAANVLAKSAPAFAVAAMAEPEPAPAEQPVPVPQPVPIQPGLVVTIDDLVGEAMPDPGVRVLLCTGETAEAALAWSNLDGVVDLLQACVDDKLADLATQTWEELLEQLLANVCDGGDFTAQIETLTRAWPRCGRVRALAVLDQWWCKGDLEAAQKAFDEGTRALAGEAVPMGVFADLVLRGDHDSPQIVRTLAVLLGQVAAAAPDGVFTQLTYLRALLRTGQDRLAGRLFGKLQKHIRQPTDQLVFAETLMEGNMPVAFRDLAEQAIAAAKTGGGNPRWCYAARHKVLTRCGDTEAAEKLMTEYRTGDVMQSSLNNDAWYTIVRPDTMGRFDTFALAQCEEMLRIEGEAMSFGSKDTMALALFRNGKIQEAVDLQTAAAAANNQEAVYVGRLTRYRAVLAELAKRPPGPEKK